jgi:hypothetical protein
MLVHPLAVHVVEVTVMQVVDVSGVPHGRMSAAWPMNMRMALVCSVPAGHVVLQRQSSSHTGTKAFRGRLLPQNPIA